MAHSVGSDLLAVHAAGQALQGGCRRITCPPSHLPTVPSSPLTSISFPVISPPTHSSAAKAPLPPAAGAAGERGRRCRDAGTWSPRQLRCTPPAAQLPAACLRRNPPQARACDLLHALHHILLAAVDHLICRNRGGGARADGSGQVQWPCADDRGGGGGGGAAAVAGGADLAADPVAQGESGHAIQDTLQRQCRGGAAAAAAEGCRNRHLNSPSPAPSFFSSSVWWSERTTLMVLTPCSTQGAAVPARPFQQRLLPSLPPFFPGLSRAGPCVSFSEYKQV